jgi:hypothetical protein
MKKGVKEGNKESGKLERGANDDSSFHLNAADNAVAKSTVDILLEHGTPTILMQIEGMSRRLILDTGSNISILQLGVSRGDIKVTMMEPYGVTGDVLDIRGLQSVSVVINGCQFKHKFLICTLPTEAAGLVGRFHGTLGAVIDFEGSKMVLPTQFKVPQV